MATKGLKGGGSKKATGGLYGATKKLQKSSILVGPTKPLSKSR